jgi:osmotically-inducible protein OsmY
MPSRNLHFYTSILLAGLVLLLQGCHEQRPVGYVVHDRNIQLTAFDAINRDKDLVHDDNNVMVVVYDGVMLLCGQVRSEELKRRAQAHVEVIEGIKRLVNDLQVTDEPEGFWRRREDDTTTARVKTALLDITSLPDFNPSRVNVTTSHHVVYVMGLVTREEAEAVIGIAREVGGVKKVVEVFEYKD